MLVAAQLALVDCQTAMPAANRNLGTARGATGSVISALGSLGPGGSGPSTARGVTADLGTTPLKQLSDAQLGTIRSTLVDLTKTSWDPAVRGLFGK